MFVLLVIKIFLESKNFNFIKIKKPLHLKRFFVGVAGVELN